MISNGHLYNLRKARAYQQRRRTVNQTRTTRVQIGERRVPGPPGPSRLLTGRYGPPGRPGRDKGAVSYQCGGPGDPDASRGLRGENIGKLPVAGAGTTARGLPLRHPGVPQ